MLFDLKLLRVSVLANKLICRPFPPWPRLRCQARKRKCTQLARANNTKTIKVP